MSAQGGTGKLTSEQVAAALWEAVVQGLSGTWPQLRQLLLAAAVQRLCRPPPPSAASADSALPSNGTAANTETTMGRPEVLAQWVGSLLGVSREDGQKRSRQQKVGAKRKSTQVESDVGGQREQWKPSLAQLSDLLAGCLRALPHSEGTQDAQVAQSRAAALRRVALMLLERKSAAQEGLSEGKAAQSQQLQRLVKMATGGTVAGCSGAARELSQTLVAAESAQKQLMQNAAAAATSSERKSSKYAPTNLQQYCFYQLVPVWSDSLNLQYFQGDLLCLVENTSKFIFLPPLALPSVQVKYEIHPLQTLSPYHKPEIHLATCRKSLWCLAEDWAPCALGMLPSPHHPCGRMPTLDAAASLRANWPTGNTAPHTTSEILEKHAADVMPEVGTVDNVMDMDLTQVCNGPHSFHFLSLWYIMSSLL